MNKIFKVIWNHSTQSWVAVAEFAKSHTKSTAAVGLSSVSTVLTKFFALSSITIAIASMVGVANAATIDGQVVGTSTNGKVVINNGGAGSGNNANMIIIGDSASTGRTNSIKIGTGITDTDTGGGGSVIVGNKTHAGGGGKDSFSVAVGNYGFVAGPSVAIGVYAKADPYDSTGANNLKAGQIAIGAGANTGVNSNDAGMAIGTIASARSNGSVAVGRLSLAGTYAANEGFGNGARFSTAIGEQTTARGYESIALGGYAMTGRNVRNQGFSGAGAGQISSGAYAIAIGGESRAINRYTLALGQDAIAGGYTAEDAATVRSWVDEAQKVRDDAKARYDAALAVYNSKNQNTYTEEIMREALESGVAYERAEADLWRAKEDVKLILEDDKVKDVSGAIAVGSSARALNKDSIAFGTGAKVYGEQSIAIGTGNLVTGNYSGVFGDPSINAGTASYIFGNDNGIGNTTSSAFILGNNNTIGSTATYNAEGKIQTNAPLEGIRDASSSFAIGNYNSITTDRTYVLGSGINTRDTLDEIKQLHGTVANSVYLGDDSDAMGSINNGVNAQGAGILRNRVLNKSAIGNTTTGGMGAVTNATVNGVTYGTFAGTTPVGIVTVGASGAERRIQNVAAGEISSTSTDAINGSQLYAVADKFGAGFDILDNAGTTKGTVTAGEKIKFANGSNTTVTVQDEVDHITTIDYSVNTGTLSAGTAGKFSVTNGTGNDSFVTTSNLANALNQVGFHLAGSAAGGTFTDAAQDKYLAHSDIFTLTAGNNIAITQNDNGYTIAANVATTTLGVTDAGKVASPSSGDVTKLVNAGDLATAINKTGFTVTSNKAKDDTNSDAKVSPGDTLNFNNGTGTTVSTDGSNVTVNVKQATAPTAGTDGKLTNPASNAADSFLTAANVVDAINNSGFTLKTSATAGGEKDEASTEDELINPGDAVEMVAGKNLTVKQKATGKVTYATKEDVSFTTIKVGAPNEDGSANENPIYIGAKDGKNVITGLDTTLPDPAGNSGTKPANVNAISNQAATLGDVLNAGWNLQGNGKEVDFVKPYDTVNFKDGANTKVVAKANDKGTSSDIQINVTGLPVQYTTKDGTPVAKVGDNYYPVDESGLPNTDADPVEAGDLITNVINPAAAPNKKGDETTLGNVKSGLETTNVPTNPKGGEVDPDKPSTDKLVNLNNKDVPDTNVATVGDLRNMGWVVSAEGNDYTDTVKNANEVKFIGTGLAKVTGETVNSIREITIDVDAQDVVEAAQLPVVYTDAEGNKLTKVDGNFYKVEDIDEETGEPKDNAAAVKPEDVIASMNNGDNSTTAPMTLTNIKSNLPSVNDADTTITNPDGTTVAADPANITKAPITAQQAAKLAADSANNAATLGDVLNAGWNLQGNGKAVDFVKPFDTVNFVNGEGTVAEVKTDDNLTSTVTYNVNVDNTTTEITYTNKDGDKVYKVGDQYFTNPEGTGDAINTEENPVTSQVSAKTTPLEVNETGDEAGKVKKPENPNSLATAGDIANAINNSGWKLAAKGTPGEELINPSETVTFETGSDNLTVKRDGANIIYDLAKDIKVDSVKAGDTTINNDGLTIANGPSVTKDGIDAAGKKITNVAAGTDDTDAVNVSQLKQAQAAATTKVDGNQGVTVTPTNNADGSTTYTVTAKTDGNTVTVDKDGNIAAVTSKLSNVAEGQPNAGKVNTPANENALATAGDIANAINNSGFTLKTSGNKLSGSDELINPGDVIDMVAGKNLTVKQEANGKVTYATKDDVVFDSVQLGDNGPKITNKDGDINVAGNGSPVKITGVADGDISPDSKDAINGSQLYTALAGAKTDVKSEDKSVTVTPNGNTFDLSVNTDDVTITKDPTTGAVKAVTSDLAVNNEGGVNTPAAPNALATAGDIANAINNSGWNLAAEGTDGTELINPSDKVTFKAGSKNLTVKRDGADITYDLAKDITVDSVKAGDTVMNNDGITINNGAAGEPVSLTKNGLNNGGNRITNVKAGEAPTDAVNVSQLKGVANQLDNKINRNNRNLRAGIAGANAAAGLPQVYIPGKSMVAAAAGTYRGEAALAVGYSRASDNGKVILKLQGNANTRGDIGGSVGIGYQW